MMLNYTLDDNEKLAFKDLFVLKDIQRLQDEFADATGVASIITDTDGTPITAPSNFCRLCNDIIRKTEKGRINCFKSDAMLGRFHPEGPIIQPCTSGGLWDAGAGITVGGRHIANWLIGQVRDETQTGEEIQAYAREIEVDEAMMLEAFKEVPSMSHDQFYKVAKMLFTLSKQLSDTAYQNFQQARFITSQKKVEHKLSMSEEKYRAMVESSIDLLWEVNQKGVYTYVSPKIKDILGYEPSEIVGRSPFDLMHEKDIERVRKEFDNAVENMDPIVALENENIHKNGKIVLLETNGVPIIDPEGKLKGYRGIDRDITFKKRIERSFLESEERFRQIFQNIGVGIAIYEAVDGGNDFIFKDINPYGAQSGQKSREDHIGNSVLDVYPGVQEIGLFQVFQEVWKTGRSKKHPISQYQDGRVTLWVDNFVTKLPTGEVMAVYEDMTAEKSSEAALILSEERYRAVFDTAPLTFVVWDTNCQILEWNDQAERTFGWNRSEAVGKNFFDLIVPEPDRQFVEQIVNELLKGDIQKHVLNKNITKKGDVIWCQWDNAVLQDVEGNISAAISLGLDITDRINKDKELKEYREHLEDLVKSRTEELEAKNKEMETFTYSVSHDLKAPLRGIDGYSRLLSEEYAEKLDEEGLRFLANIRYSTDQMTQLIEDLLTYSRMERRDLRATQINIRALIDELILEREHEISSKSAQVESKIPTEQMICDRDSMRQIMGNLLDNAIKFTREKTRANIEIGGSEPPDAWKFWVKDNGVGFDPKYQDRIFGIFQRLHRAEDYPGTGVGLALVQKAVHRMGGSIRAEGKPGEGAVFFLEIPKS